MTKKQINILEAALRLFAVEGYHSTSTSKIAKEAGVSEGLIFRHFKNKEGLLEAILLQGQERGMQIFAALDKLKDPKEILSKIIEIPFHINPDEYAFWRLIYSLKWQQRKYNIISFSGMFDKAILAFEALGYDDPKAEVAILEIILDGAATVILLKEEIYEKEKMLKAIKEKYSLNN